jgi:hypothetical protein
MSRRLMAITLSMLLIVSVFPAIALGTNVTLTLSADSATVGTSVTASGIADADTFVSVKVLDSDQKIVFFDAVKSSTSGDYSCTFKIPQVSPGTLTVVAGYGSNVDTKPLTVSVPDTNIPVSGVSLNKNSLILVEGKSETLVETLVPASASNKAVTWLSNNEAVVTVDDTGKVNAIRPGTATVTVITADGHKTAICAITVTKPVTATSGSTVTIEEDTPVTITVPKGVSSTITVTQNVKLPLVEVKAETSLGTVEMAIPEGAKVVNAPSDWKGTITLPEVKAQPSTAVSGAQQVNAVIEVGLPDEEITFDKAVRLLVPGQKGKSAGYIRNGKFTEITYPITKDDQATADKELINNIKDGKADTGNDLAIWTKHFTEFIAYTPVATEENKGGGGGGGSISDSKTISPKGGTVDKAGAEVYFPADAVTNKIKVTIKKLTTGIPAVSSGFKLVSDVYEISSDENSEIKKPVKITLPFDRSKVDNDKYDVGIYCWNNNQWVILDEVKVDTAAGKVSGEVNHFSKFAVLASEKAQTPTDEIKDPEPAKPALKDINGHWAETNISKLVAAGAVSGYPDGTFKPDNTISRAEFATILVKAFKLESKEGKVFTDTANHWAREAIATAAANGIVNGYSDTTFGPNDNITREQMAVMIAKAAKLTDATEGKSFADGAQISDWAKEAVVKASGNGIISGYPDNTFKPQATATRAEAVTVIVKALSL